MAQNCIPLAGSTLCPAFNQSSISTNPTLVGYFPFLSFVSDVASFDDRLQNYIATSFTQQRYEQLIGCDNVNLTNTTDYYARYTTSVICNAIVQNSEVPCGLTIEQMRPLCAQTCAQYALSEHAIASSPDLCGSPGDNAISQIRADFTNCALPADSLSGTCIAGVDNEPDNCGYQSNLSGLCSFCATSSLNSTDSCCITAQVEARCEGVDLPSTTFFAPVFPHSTSISAPPTSATSSPTTAPAAANAGLSAGQIAGIVIGALLGALVLLGLIICACVLLRRRRNGSQTSSVFNQPSPSRQGAPHPQPMIMSAAYDGSRNPEILPGGRVARMAALEDTSSSSAHAGYHNGSSDEYNTSPESRFGTSPSYGLGLGGGPLPKREGSLSSRSALDALASSATDPTSPQSNSNGDYASHSSPEGVASGQSEQLGFFKDYYSQDEIRPGDTVATLWAYQPRAADEFELERGDLLKVVGIWDDGWATGIKLSERAEEFEARGNGQRDSGMSGGSVVGDVGTGEIKAFPLVCVCVPRHWRKTIEGDSTGLRERFLTKEGADGLFEKKSSCIENYRAFFLDTVDLDWDAVKATARRYLPTISRNRYSTHLVDEMRGIAQGAGVDFEDILALNVRSEIALAAAPQEAVPPDGCSAFSLLAKEGARDVRWLAQNWDWKGSQLPNVVILRIQTPQGVNLTTVTEAGIVGKVGFNDCGVGVTLNALRAVGTDYEKLPIHILLRCILEAKSVSEALGVVRSCGNGGAGCAGHLLIADPGRAVGVEVSPFGIGLIEPDSKARDLITHTNHWISESRPLGLKELPWLPDSGYRNERLSKLTSGLPSDASEDDLLQVLKDTENGCGAICRPVDPSLEGTAWGGTTTVFGIIMNLTKREGLVVFDRPCLTDGETVRLSA
ncbi:hypothetical protein H2201_002355 [Coniosporium apollinis]|uniref:SH3 domain-containing protein n=1 Tax=Coniosporium apollinis TaxID=61459 RepID=A0ABQ9NYN0_9PEZI|nr:hypothetical protein H2201_002355 [Coniosporium apollinis]